MLNGLFDDGRHPYRLSGEAVLDRLKSDRERGLSPEEVVRRQQRYGKNILEKTRKRSVVRLLIKQVQDMLVVLLIVAAVLAWYLDDLRGAGILITIVLVNAMIGFFQEYRAERILERLRDLIQANATVLRDGVRREVPETDLVPGDVVFLEEGNAVPADLRLIEANAFATNDFTITGESVPQDRQADIVIDRDVGLTDQDNLAFFGTTVARGSALGVVVATGMGTMIGGIASTSEDIERTLSPLQREINVLAKTLTGLAGITMLAVFTLNLFFLLERFDVVSEAVNASLLFAIGVAAACVPQGLPAQISVALSQGARWLSREQAVVKRLSAVETLGSTTVICTDKTGTITSNEMTIVQCWVNGRNLEVTGSGYVPDGEIRENDKPLSRDALRELAPFFRIGFLAGDSATHAPDGGHRTWYAIGDPTEAAFMPLVIKAGLDPDDLTTRFDKVDELPFDSQRKRMTVLCRDDAGRLIAFMKGAPASVLECCDRMAGGQGVVALDRKQQKTITTLAGELAEQSMRVIGLAWRDFPEDGPAPDPATIERDFVFAGIAAMSDPPREGVADAVTAMRRAHVRMFMLTGDHPVTASAISERVGMRQGRVLTGDELQDLSDPELAELLRAPALIFSRVSPADKHRIVKTLKEMGEVVAVTGDGVNDTLSLKQADIGVAMGRLGSDVAKEAAEIILMDDDFSTLANAVRIGRTIFQNIRNIVLASITSNLGELGCVCLGFIGMGLGMPVPITAVQILSIDLIGEMLPLMALTFDPPDRHLMEQRPRRIDVHIVNRQSFLDLLVFGLLMGGGGYGAFYIVLQSGAPIGEAQAAAYVAIVLTQYVNILSRRSSDSVFSGYLLTNAFLHSALLGSFLVLCVIVSFPDIGSWFGFAPLRPANWIWPVMAAVIFLVCFELKKYLCNRKKPTS